jgi:hypothetical protein
MVTEWQLLMADIELVFMSVHPRILSVGIISTVGIGCVLVGTGVFSWLESDLDNALQKTSC